MIKYIRKRAQQTPGAQLAILSDLSQFKVNAEISDSYAGKFSVGNHVEIKIGNKYFTGSIANIIPAINNGRVNLLYYLTIAQIKC